jgi:hypothetical protein
MAAFELGNLDGFLKGLHGQIDEQKKKVEAARREAVRTLVESLIANIPVWSGRTVSSVRVANSSVSAPLKGDPPRATWSRFGRTSVMDLGSEPMRKAAEAEALAQVDNADYDFDKALFVTIHSEAWGLVERAVAPDARRARNAAVVSTLALAKTKSRHTFLKGG